MEKLVPNALKNVIPSDFKICPICGYKGKFEDYGTTKKRPNSKCPDCGSTERVRFEYLYLITESFTEDGSRIVHLMPEQAIRYKLNKIKGLEYKVGGLQDIDSIILDESNIDCIIANNVVDRVEDDVVVLRQMYSSMSKGASAILTVNMVEDKEIDLKSTPRKYGINYIEILRKIGFEAEIINAYDYTDPSLCYLFGIGLKDYLVVARKN